MVLMATGTFALSLAVVVGLVYLGIARLMDLNEKEPVWAMSVALALGALAAIALPLLVDSVTLELKNFQASFWEELAKFAALLVAVALFDGLSRLRGWSEINGLMEGVMYGTAVGLGFATGEAFARELAFGGLVDLVGVSRFDVLWTTLLDGLSDGLFGAIVGAGFGLAVQARHTTLRLAYPVIGLAGAILAQYVFLLVQGSEGGSSGQLRSWLALLLPVVFVLTVVLFSLAQERRALETNLAPEGRAGVLTDEEIRLVQDPARRRREYTRRLASGDLDGWAALRTLHNRSVQLALVKRRAEREPDPQRRAAIDADAERLRAAIVAAHREMDARAARHAKEAEVR
jgi:hypothetical protein